VPQQNAKGHVQIIGENGVNDVVEVACRTFGGGGKVRGKAVLFNDDRDCGIIGIVIIIVSIGIFAVSNGKSLAMICSMMLLMSMSNRVCVGVFCVGEGVGTGVSASRVVGDVIAADWCGSWQQLSGGKKENFLWTCLQQGEYHAMFGVRLG